MTLLELIIASTMMTLVVVSISVVLRTGRGAWEAHESDFVRMEAAHATVRHIVRAIRQAAQVTAISLANNNSGSLSVQDNTGKIWVWSHDANTGTVFFGENNASSMLGDHITGLRFEGFEADGTTPTTVTNDLQCIRITVSTVLDRDANANRAVTSWAWVRTW